MPLPARDLAELRLSQLPELLTIQGDSGLRLELAEEPDLTYLFWECTARCNLRCTHCGSSCEPSTPFRELGADEFLAVVRTVAEDFDLGRVTFAITGGEPLMRADLFEVIARLGEMGAAGVGIVTNATLLTRERARRLRDAGLMVASVSVDGAGALHDDVRGAGSLAKTLAGIEAARSEGLLVEVITCVRPANVGRLADVERTVRGAGASNWRLVTIGRMGRAEHDPQFWLEPIEVRQLFDFIERRRAELARAREEFDLRFSCGGFVGVGRERAVRPQNGQCFAGLGIASILCDGQVSACPSMPRSWAQGSVLETRFSTIWRERFARFRDFGWRRSGRCERCDWGQLCMGGGLHERLVQPEDFCWLGRQGL
jgi:radical SAM protein with 4Fe4S-binding SPASM domain